MDVQSLPGEKECEVVVTDKKFSSPITPPFNKPSEAPENGDVKFPATEISRIKVFRCIEANEPTTRYFVSKATGISYSSVKQILKDLLHAEIVHEQPQIQDNGTFMKILTIPKEAEK